MTREACCGVLVDAAACRDCPLTVCPRHSSLPFVSCLCPTAREPDELHLLAEAVHWFTVQQYPPDRRELIILNDIPHRKLRCTAPGVIVVNRHRPFQTLGAKRNALIEMARGEVLLPWDDDDVSLPGRIPQAVAMLDGYDYWDPKGRWYEVGGRINHPGRQNCTHHASAYRKAAGRYRHTTGDEDQFFVRDLWPGARVNSVPLVDPKDWTYVYRWGVSGAHLSGSVGKAGGMPGLFAGRRESAPFGRPEWYLIEPARTSDYAARCRDLWPSATTTSASAAAGSATPSPPPGSCATSGPSTRT